MPSERGKVLVTGATGNVGRATVEALLAKGSRVVGATTDVARARRTTDLDVDVPGLEFRAFRFGGVATYPGALEGVGRVFLMRPGPVADVEDAIFPFVDAAKSAGVAQIAFMSLMGVEQNRRLPHYRVERYLLESGVPTTLLRPGFFMQNFNTVHQVEIRDRDEIAVPVGKAKTSFIDVRDIGAVAAEVLTEPGHEGRAYTLTGGEALDYFEVADLFTEVLGRRIIYTRPSLPGFVVRSLTHGRSLKFTLVMAALYTATRFGPADRVTDAVPQLLGRPPITMRRYIEDYADAWR